MKCRRPWVREALERAGGDTRPDVSRLVGAVPDLIAEARRRVAQPEEFPALLAARAWWAVPRLAVATVVAVVLASIMLFVERGSAATRATSLESVILGGASASGDGTGDVLLDAVLTAEKNDG